MNGRCPVCQASFHIADDKIPAGGARGHCPQCNAQIDLAPPASPSGVALPGNVDDVFELSPGSLEEVGGEDLFGVHDQPSDSPATASAAPAAPRRRRGLFGWLGGLFGRS